MGNRFAAACCLALSPWLAACGPKPPEPADNAVYLTGLHHEESEEWANRSLRRLHEPPLSSPADLDGFEARYRMTRLPSFSGNSSIRVDVAKDGSATIYRSIASYWDEESALTCWRSDTMGRADLERLERALAAVPRSDWIGDERAAGFDGTAYIFERLDRSGHLYGIVWATDGRLDALASAFTDPAPQMPLWQHVERWICRNNEY